MQYHVLDDFKIILLIELWLHNNIADDIHNLKRPSTRDRGQRWFSRCAEQFSSSNYEQTLAIQKRCGFGYSMISLYPAQVHLEIDKNYPSAIAQIIDFKKASQANLNEFIANIQQDFLTEIKCLNKCVVRESIDIYITK